MAGMRKTAWDESEALNISTWCACSVTVRKTMVWPGRRVMGRVWREWGRMVTSSLAMAPSWNMSRRTMKSMRKVTVASGGAVTDETGSGAGE